MRNDFIKIDGSFLEGGGQILRTSLALSFIFQKPCLIYNIRANREKPGLQVQHLLGVQALSKLCGGILEGDYLNSQEIKFYPGNQIQESISLTIDTAASITLILQMLILSILFSEINLQNKVPNDIKITFNGGATNTFFSPTMKYFEMVFLKSLKKVIDPEIEIDFNILRHGFYPKGEAQLIMNIKPLNIFRKKSLILKERGELKNIYIFSGASKDLQKRKVAERQVSGIRNILRSILKLPLRINISYEDTLSTGSFVCIVAEFENSIVGVDKLGKIQKSAEEIGKEAVLEFLEEIKSEACFDKYNGDQILPYIAITKKRAIFTVSQITNHLKTNTWVIEKFLNGKFKIKKNVIYWESIS